jgi:hypothetical protein
MERWNQSIKSECIGPGLPLSLHTAKHPIAWSVAVYNEQRLHSSLGYVTPKDMLEGRQAEIHGLIVYDKIHIMQHANGAVDELGAPNSSQRDTYARAGERQALAVAARGSI